MKKITRTIKGYEINYIEIDTNTMSMERKTEFSDTPITESAFNKLIKESGKLAADIEIKPYNNGVREMTLDTFYLFGTKIEKKSQIKGRSITKEMRVKTATCIAARKMDGEWKIEEIELEMFDGEFSTADYNINGYFQILEVGTWSDEKTYLIGMSEEEFIKHSTIA